ncbi:hypothetical protein BKA80DRAFT_201272 [Phyllosticta citrichinensis]
MLPPLDPSIFERNPRFKALYDDLSQNKLNADASTKNSKKQIQAERAREVNAKQTNAAKTNIIGSTLDHVAWKDARLPEEVRGSRMHEVTVIAADQVNRRIPKNHQDILEPDLEFFKENIESVSALLEDSITSTALQLCRIIDPDDLDCSLLDDPPHILGLQQEIEAQSSSLGAYRAHLSDLAASIMQAQAELMEVVVRIMEQTAHGTLARFLRAKAEHLAAVSEGLEKKLSIVTLSQETPASLQMALKKYKEHVSREKSELEHRGEIASDKLNAFDEAGKGRGDMMRQIAQRYVEIEAEIQKVQREMEKLDGR